MVVVGGWWGTWGCYSEELLMSSPQLNTRKDVTSVLEGEGQGLQPSHITLTQAKGQVLMSMKLVCCSELQVSFWNFISALDVWMSKCHKGIFIRHSGIFVRHNLHVC